MALILIVALVAMVAFTLLFVAGALAEYPDERSDMLLGMGVAGVVVSMIAVAGSALTVLS